MPNNNNILDAEVPLRYLSNFWRSLDLLLINCEIELDLSWSKECIRSEISITPGIPGNPNANPPVLAVAVIQNNYCNISNNAKLYVPVTSLSVNDNIKLLKNIKQRFKRTISWNKYRSEITTQTKKQ